MKVIIVALALVAIAAAAPAVEKEQVAVYPEPIQILRSLFETQPSGGYTYGFESGNGINREETGEIVEILDEEKKPHPVVIVRGSWTYTNDKGELETMTYTADQDGFHPEGPSIPKAVSPVSRR